jgi:protein-tyrosine phosphatase
MKILMVCLGNICRSPLAEGILQHKAAKAGLNWTIESAGTNGFHTGEAPHHLSQKVARGKGIDISKQLSRKFEAADFEKYDRIYAMAADVMDAMKRIGGEKFNPGKTMFFLDELYPAGNQDVPDPWYGDEDGYVDVYTLIDTTCDAIIENYFAQTIKPGKING